MGHRLGLGGAERCRGHEGSLIRRIADVLDHDWLGACRRAAETLGDLLVERPSSERLAYTGDVGGGGDHTLVIDRDAEAGVFAELDALHAAGARFTAISEERGTVDYGSPDAFVVIDPIDGSSNAKRGLPHHALSIAVADGPTMADVRFAFVHDFGPQEEWTAVRGAGAHLDGVLLDPTAPDRRSRSGRLELVGIEGSDPRLMGPASDQLAEVAHRLRALGTIAVTMCQVAAARLDGMVTLRRSRAVDAAAAQLIVREGGGHVAFTACSDPLGARLDGLDPVSAVVAARSRQGLATLARVPAAGPR